ncbi:MAG: archease [Patescibacteria group bacterium]|nr:archease [Patescibacteria group bacterium]
MKKFELQPDFVARVTASTKAGLLSAAMQGMFTAAKPKWVKEDPVEDQTNRRRFSVTAEDFSTLVVRLLNEALSAAAANRESYEDLSLAFVTDTKVEGEFVGRAVRGFGTPIKTARKTDAKVERNADGQWETVVEFET